MQITVLGSADAANSAGRCHSCYWIAGLLPEGLMVDFGGTALYALKRAGFDPRRLGTIMFTHLHGDHIGGFPFLFVDALYGGGRTEPLRLLGPRGLQERLEQLVRVSYGKLADKEAPFDISWHELAPGEEVDLGKARVKAFRAHHTDPPEVPLCLRISTDDDSTVAFSGDTRICDGLLEAGRGADLLVAECTHLAPPAGGHSTWQEWRELLPTIGARRVLLTHLATEVRARVDELRKTIPEGVEFAEDGIVLEV